MVYARKDCKQSFDDYFVDDIIRPLRINVVLL